MTASGRLDRALASCPSLETSLRVLADAHWPADAEATPPPPIPGFIVSDFAPLAVDVAERCLRAGFGNLSIPDARAARTAVVLISVSGDQATAAAVAEAVDSGRRVSGLLFFQSVPNSVLGWIASRWQLEGPVVCTSPSGDALAEAAAISELLIGDGDLDYVLVLRVELGDSKESRGFASAFLLTRPTECGEQVVVAGESMRPPRPRKLES